ncbi:unnamed protein product [Closterium sp. Naga37s-1]|nr:unnamed protein product [Closterium sp. Naga37s-1]
MAALPLFTLPPLLFPTTLEPSYRPTSPSLCGELSTPLLLLPPHTHLFNAEWSPQYAYNPATRAAKSPDTHPFCCTTPHFLTAKHDLPFLPVERGLVSPRPFLPSPSLPPPRPTAPISPLTLLTSTTPHSAHFSPHPPYLHHAPQRPFLPSPSLPPPRPTAPISPLTLLTSTTPHSAHFSPHPPYLHHAPQRPFLPSPSLPPPRPTAPISPLTLLTSTTPHSGRSACSGWPCSHVPTLTCEERVGLPSEHTYIPATLAARSPDMRPPCPATPHSTHFSPHPPYLLSPVWSPQ